MSTISSQLLVSSSSLSEDLYKTFIRPSAGQKELVMVSRFAILVVSALALLLALDQDNSILSLVSNAWAGFGAAFGPLVILSLFWKGMTRNGALACMISGAVTVLIWVFAPITIGGQTLPSIIYEIVPGFVVATVAAIIVSKLSPKPEDHLMEHFKKVEDIIAAEVR
jgi:SSS family solute:Na+ symporter/sodium/proline symporter